MTVVTVQAPDGSTSQLLLPAIAVGPVSPVAGMQTLAWNEDFTGPLDLTRWTVQDGTTRSNEQSVAKAANVTIAKSIMSIHAQPLATPVVKLGHQVEQVERGHSGQALLATATKTFAYGSGYVDTIGKPLLGIRPGSFVEMLARMPLSPRHSAGLWPALWYRSQLTGLEIDWPEGWGTISAQDASAGDAPQGRPAFNVYPDTSTTTGKIGGWALAAGGMDMTLWHRYGLLYELDGSVTPYLDGLPQKIVAGKGVGKSRITAADVATLKPVANDYLNIRIQLQVGGSYYGSPDAATDWSQTLDVDRVTCWTK